MQRICKIISILLATLAGGSVWAENCTSAPGAVCPGTATVLSAPQPPILLFAPKVAPVSCSPVGNWVSSGGLGSPVVIRQDLTGTFTPSYCPAPFPLIVSVQGNALSVVATWTGPAVCQSFTESLTFSADCSQATGTFTNADSSSGPEVWNRTGGKLSIISPTDQSEVTVPNSVSFQADPGAGNSGVAISWKNTLEYQTSGGRGAYSDQDTFTTTDKGTNTKSHSNVGGKLTVNVSASINGAPQTAGPNTAYLVGFSIPNATITTQLVSIYSGATPRLLTGIATVESTYRQFATRTLYGHSALWPLESYDGGSHIGVMQMPVTKAHAWDWIINTQDAAVLFAAKLTIARKNENAIIASHPGLPALTGVERENMALVRYGPYASSSLSMQYYAPIKDSKNKWIWTVNTAGNPDGVAYADSIRSSMK